MQGEGSANAVANYKAQIVALEGETKIDRVTHMREMSQAAIEYARRAKDTELISNATEMKLRAERRVGQLLKQMVELGQRRPQGTATLEDQARMPTLKELGISKDSSSKWQKRADMSDAEFEAFVEHVKKHALLFLRRDGSRFGMRARRAEREAALAEKTLAMPERKYNVILEDYEWDFQVFSRETGMSRHAANHYAVGGHTADEIVEKTRDRFECAADDCVLFMWTTVPFLAVAIEVMRLRGFRYVSNFVWGKDRRGTGYWNRNVHELLLVGVRGKIPAPGPGEQWDSLIDAPVREHSRKPEEFRELIDFYFPNLPKIELNCRGAPRQGWDAWGAEAEPPVVDIEVNTGADDDLDPVVTEELQPWTPPVFGRR